MRKLLMLDPEFSPGSEHTAHALVTNNTPKTWTYSAELYLVKGGTKYTSSGTITFSLAAGASRTIDFPITMPDIEGTYKVYLDVFVAGELVAAYQAIEDVVISAPVGAWECPVCGAKFATYPELRSHCYSAHPSGVEQIGMAIRNLGATSADLCAGATMGCYFHFWLEDGTARKVAQSGYVAAHVDFCRHITGLVTGRQYLFAAFGVSGNRVVYSSMYFTPHEPW